MSVIGGRSGAVCRRSQTKGHAEIHVAGSLGCFNESAVPGGIAGSAENEVVHLRRYIHRGEIADGPGMMGSIQIEVVQRLQAGVVYIDQNNRVVISGAQPV